MNAQYHFSVGLSGFFIDLYVFFTYSGPVLYSCHKYHQLFWACFLTLHVLANRVVFIFFQTMKVKDSSYILNLCPIMKALHRSALRIFISFHSLHLMNGQGTLCWQWLIWNKKKTMNLTYIKSWKVSTRKLRTISANPTIFWGHI